MMTIVYEKAFHVKFFLKNGLLFDRLPFAKTRQMRSFRRTVSSLSLEPRLGPKGSGPRTGDRRGRTMASRPGGLLGP